MAAKTKYNIQFENSWNMDEKGYLLGLFHTQCASYNLANILSFKTGLGTAQVYCVSCGTKEAKKMQGILFSLIDHS